MKSGLFSDPSVWEATTDGRGTCNPVPTSTSSDIILISGYAVVLDAPYVVGQRGVLKITNQGSLVGGTDLTVGDGTGDRTNTTLSLAPGSTLQVAQLRVNKATVQIDQPLSASSPTSLTTDCNMVLSNSVVIDNGRAFINGSVDVSSGAASNQLCGSGVVRIMGCVFGGNGAVKQLAENCASSLVTTVCSQQVQPAGCPGPMAGNNTNQQACDGLVAACGPLPVELLVFTASVTERQAVTLRWATASEKNSQRFIIERSADGKNFKEIGSKPAAGSSTNRTNYEYLDQQPLFGTGYYRLRQLDHDGTTAFSPVQLVRLGSANAEGLAVYPAGQPQQWVVSSALAAEALAGGPAAVQVFDALGRPQLARITPDATQAGRWLLDLHGRPTGIYIVRLTTSAGTFSQRIGQ